MATRMQQRRGTALQWTSADPILAAGEIGFETDTGQFKIGDGINVWSSLSHFKDIVDLGGNLDDYLPLSLVGANDGVAPLNSTGQVASTYLTDVIDAITDATLVSISAEHSTISGEITTALADERSYTSGVISTAIGDERSYTSGVISTAIGNATESITSNVGIAINIAKTEAISDAADDATAKANTAQSNAETSASGYVATHAADTTDVHGISDTSALVTLTGTQTLTGKTISAADNAVTVNLADVIDVTASASEVNILDGATLTVTELNYVDGVTSSIQTQLDAKAPLANPTFTGTVNAGDIEITGNLTVGGTTTTVNATDLSVADPLIYIGEGNDANIVDLGLVSSFNDGSYQHAGIVRDATDGVWKLFSSVEDEPTTTVNFSQAVYDTLKVGGIEYADGVQVKQGVPSLTTINQQAGAYTTVLSDRDKLIEVNSASGVTVTVPSDSSVAYPVGTSIDILQTGSGQVLIAGSEGVTVNATPGRKLRTQWSSATLFKRAIDTWVLFGDLTA